MATILIKNGRIIDPANDVDKVMDILIRDDKIEDVADEIKCNADEVVDAEGLAVMPGFIDLHVHLREPGFEY